MSNFETGQRWTYRPPAGFEGSRIVIGAIVSFREHSSIVCCSVLSAPRRLANNGIDRVTIPFLPLSEAALLATVVALDGVADLPHGFEPALADWRGDERGLSVFTVPFDGFLDRLIARQMAAIIGLSAA